MISRTRVSHGWSSCFERVSKIYGGLPLCEFHVSVERCISDLHQKYRSALSVSCKPVLNRFPKPSALNLDCVIGGKVISWGGDHKRISSVGYAPNLVI